MLVTGRALVETRPCLSGSFFGCVALRLLHPSVSCLPEMIYMQWETKDEGMMFVTLRVARMSDREVQLQFDFIDNTPNDQANSIDKRSDVRRRHFIAPELSFESPALPPLNRDVPKTYATPDEFRDIALQMFHGYVREVRALDMVHLFLRQPVYEMVVEASSANAMPMALNMMSETAFSEEREKLVRVKADNAPKLHSPELGENIVYDRLRKYEPSALLSFCLMAEKFDSLRNLALRYPDNRKALESQLDKPMLRRLLRALLGSDRYESEKRVIESHRQESIEALGMLDCCSNFVRALSEHRSKADPPKGRTWVMYVGHFLLDMVNQPVRRAWIFAITQETLSGPKIEDMPTCSSRFAELVRELEKQKGESPPRSLLHAMMFQEEMGLDSFLSSPITEFERQSLVELIVANGWIEKQEYLSRYWLILQKFGITEALDRFLKSVEVTSESHISPEALWTSLFLFSAPNPRRLDDPKLYEGELKVLSAMSEKAEEKLCAISPASFDQALQALSPERLYLWLAHSPPLPPQEHETANKAKRIMRLI